MPKRTTLNFSSETAPKAAEGDKLYVYYCVNSSRHVMTTDVDLQRAPRRRTDSARVIDSSQHSVRLYTTAADSPIVLQRPDGTFEKQYRQYSAGKLPIAYRSEPDGKFLYVLDGAVTTFSQEDKEAAVPVPPCIRHSGPRTVEVILELSDRGTQLKLVKISADVVKVQTTKSNAAEDANEELLEFARGILGTNLSDVTMMRGSSARHRRLLVSGLSPLQVYQKLQGAL